MEIRRWHCYIAINCAFIIPCIVAKSISLNEIIAAENQKKHTLESTPEPKIRETTENLAQKSETTNKLWIKSRKLKEKYVPIGKQISLLKYRKTFDIKSPLKGSNLKYKLLNRLKNQSTKREIGDNEKNNRKYTPILRNLGVLFNNLFNTGDNEAIDFHNNRKYKRNKKYTEKNGMVCTCTRQSSSEISNAKSQKKTIVTTTSFPSETSIAPKIATKTTVDTAVANVSSIGSHKDVPLLLSRNTSSSWRNYNGHSEGSGPTFHRSNKRNIPWDNGNSENLTRVRENESGTESNEKNTYSASRDDAGRNGFKRRNRNNTRVISINRSTANKKIKQSKNENNKTGYASEPQIKNKHDARGNKTESRISVPKHDRRSRGLISKNKISSDTEPVQSKENYEESYDRITFDHTNDKRIPSGSRTFTTKNQNVNKQLETVISTKDTSDLTLAPQSTNDTLVADNQNISEELETLISIKDSSNLTLVPQDSNDTLPFNNQNITEELETVISVTNLSNLTLPPQSPNDTFVVENQNITEELETVISIMDLSNVTLAPQSPNDTLVVENQNITEELETVISISNLTLPPNDTLPIKEQNVTEELETVISIQDSVNLTLAPQSSNDHPPALENKNSTEELETVISIKDLSNLTLALQGPPKGKVPVVTIFGGYSVARDINGQNKLAEQSIVIQS